MIASDDSGARAFAFPRIVKAMAVARENVWQRNAPTLGMSSYMLEYSKTLPAPLLWPTSHLVSNG